VNTQVHPENCSDESIHAQPNAHIQSVRFSLPKDPWQLITATLLALSILVNIALIFAYRYDAQERDLDRYDDGIRESATAKEMSNLSARITTDHDLIQAYGLQKALQEKADGRPYHH